MKVTKTYSIEQSIFDAFDRLTNEKNINKSSFIEKSIKKFLKENGEDYIELTDKVFISRLDEHLTVSVVSQDSDYYCLTDGSKVNKILFYHIFKEIETVDPDIFFSDYDKYRKSYDSVDFTEPIVNIKQSPYLLDDQVTDWLDGEKDYIQKMRESAIEDIIKNNPQSCWKKYEHKDINFDNNFF